MTSEQRKSFLESLPDVDVIEETARRLKRRYRDDHGISLGFGAFEFVFEDGVFDGIDECTRTTSYESPRRLRLVPRD